MEIHEELWVGRREAQTASVQETRREMRPYQRRRRRAYCDRRCSACVSTISYSNTDPAV